MINTDLRRESLPQDDDEVRRKDNDKPWTLTAPFVLIRKMHGRSDSKTARNRSSSIRDCSFRIYNNFRTIMRTLVILH